MANQPKTPLRTMRIDDELWAELGAVTDDRSATVRDLIRWYVRRPGVKLPKRPVRSADGDLATDLPPSVHGSS